MNDELDPKLEALFTAARAEEAGTEWRGEFGFETRVLARLREERGASVFSWAWKLCPFFAALALAAGMWSWSTNARMQTDASVIAEVSRQGDEQLLETYMTGVHR
jgi:hypothetical protein